MGQDDRFSGSGDPNRTIIRPTPGGRRRPTQSERPFEAPRHMDYQRPPESPPRSAEPPPVEPPRSIDPPKQRYPDMERRGGGAPVGAVANQMTTNALPLLMLVPKLRKVAYHSAISDLQERLIIEIGGFQNRSLQHGYSEEQVRTASYLICSLIDETVLNTPWGADSNWGHDTLLVKFHREAVGGEEFFPIVERLMRRPADNIDLLELAYMCLSLGFEGKYRIVNNGPRLLEDLRTEIYDEIRRIRGDSGCYLSVNWQGLRDLRNPLTRYIPMWVVATASAVLLLALFLVYSWLINRASNRIYGDWMTIASEDVKPPEPAPTVALAPPLPKPPDPKFKDLLGDEVSRGMVIVLDGPVLRLTNAFTSGSDQVRKDYIPLLMKIGKALRDDPNRRVEVIGHTDNKPIFTARFPSNWDLSNARAKAVADILEEQGSLGTRISSKGRAEMDPVAPNDTPEHRALNRRTDVHIR